MTTLPSRQHPALPAWARWWFPPVLLVVIMTIRAIDQGLYSRVVDGELGLIELATPLAALAGVVCGLLAFRRLGGQPLLVRGWALALALACFYLAGEELSWGQHLFGWGTPETIAELNDQNETNLHNMSSWFDQKPRLLLELFVLIGGIIVPLREGRRRTPYVPGSVTWWCWPTRDTLVTAWFAILVRVPDRLLDILPIERMPLQIRYSEPQEYYFALFLALYLAGLWRRAVMAGTGAP